MLFNFSEIMQWRCYYSSNKNGFSFVTLYDQCKYGNFEESILLIKDNFNNVTYCLFVIFYSLSSLKVV